MGLCRKIHFKVHAVLCKLSTVIEEGLETEINIFEEYKITLSQNKF